MCALCISARAPQWSPVDLAGATRCQTLVRSCCRLGTRQQRHFSSSAAPRTVIAGAIAIAARRNEDVVSCSKRTACVLFADVDHPAVKIREGRVSPGRTKRRLEPPRLARSVSICTACVDRGGSTLALSPIAPEERSSGIDHRCATTQRRDNPATRASRPSSSEHREHVAEVNGSAPDALPAGASMNTYKVRGDVCQRNAAPHCQSRAKRRARIRFDRPEL